jgi:isoleucyl-tRNA synthetase
VWTDMPDSVHLRAWPQVDGALVDTLLSEQMSLVRRLVELGRSARAESKVRTRQPLARALVHAPGWDALPEELRNQVIDELNVRKVVADDGTGDFLVVDTVVKANFRALGKRFGNRTQVVAAAVAASNAAELALAIADTGSVSIVVDGEQVVLSADDLVITETPTLGWAVASDAGLSVALDLELTEELRRAGMAREAIRFAQETRKTSGLEISDRIEFWWQAGDDRLVFALREHEAAIAAEILAVTVTEGRPSADITPHEDPELGLTIWMRVAGG